MKSMILLEMSPTKQARGDSGKEPKLHRWQNGEKTLGETRLSRGASSPPARWTSSLFQLQQSQIVSEEWRRNGWRPFSGSFGRGGVIGLCDWQCKTDSYRRPLHVTPDSEQMRSSSASWQRLSMSSGWNGLRLRSHLAAGWTSVFSRGAIKPPTNALSPSSPFFPFAPHSSRIRPSASAALTSVDGAEKKEYERMPPLDESVAAHLYPPTAIGWKARASHPSKLCIYTRWTRLLGSWTSGFGASLYGCALGLPGQDARQWGSRSGCSFTQGPEEQDRPGPARH